MGLLITQLPHHASELLECTSLIRYAARYHNGLGWCVYDIKFQKKAATDKSLKWSTIDSQLWLKTFTVAPSLLDAVSLEGLLDDNLCLASAVSRYEQVLEDTLNRMAPITSRLITFRNNAPWYRDEIAIKSIRIHPSMWYS